MIRISLSRDPYPLFGIVALLTLMDLYKVKFMKFNYYNHFIFPTRLIAVAVLSLTLVHCKKKKAAAPEETVEPFDKQGMLVNIADNVILPAYNSFKLSIDSLTAAFETFKNSGLTADFQVAKQKLNSAYLSYQRVDLYEFGPAENLIFRMNCNIFPTDTVQIKSNISNGSYDLSSAANFDAKGFPALDFLFYGNNQSETSVIMSFTSSSTKKQYVSDVIADISSKINSIISAWNSSYRNTFTNSLGTDVGSSIGYLVNQISFELDYLKNAKIGTPLGKKTLGVPAPEKCEAYYGSQSLLYANETLRSIEDAYLGRSLNGTDGKGFDDYLEHLKADYNGTLLHTAISNQFALAKSKLAAIPGALSTQVITNASQVDAAYVELVKLLVLLKTDVPSQLGVIITYQDGDGD
jgi:predicted lipoprotein